jgi:hypothetical protein
MDKIPPFLAGGTFSWGELDYRFSEPPPQDLLAQSALESPDPWIELAAVLERAKRGNHSAMARVPRLIRLPDASTFLVRCALDLLGTAGTKGDLKALQSVLLEGADYQATEGCRGAYCAGCLWLVPAMLDAWRRVGSLSDRESISCRLSELLEPPGGPIGPPLELADAEYQDLVQSRVNELRSQLGTEDLPILRGEVFGVRSLALYMHSLTRSDIEVDTLGVMFLPLRHKFECATGIDCSSFFIRGNFAPLSAAAVLEDFLASSAAKEYEEGIRYFFGHRIPD